MTDRMRRNGRPSSCEPCRLSKLRCDHGRPHCARCIRRNISQQCYYHPSPMTRAAASPAEHLLATQKPTASNSPAVSAPLPNPSAHESCLESDYDRGTGMVTMQSSLMPLAEAHGSQNHRSFAYLTRASVITPKRPYPITPGAVAEGVDVLRSLVEFSADLREVVSEQDENGQDELCSALFYKSAWRATQNTLQSLGPRPSLEQLTSTALAVFEQTANPLELPQSAEHDSVELALSGNRLRWDTIGMCFVKIGLLSAVARVNNEPFNGGGKRAFDRQKMMHMAFNACVKTRAFCDQIEQTNDLTLWLLVYAITLATWCFGDDSSRVWRLMGDLASSLAALGSHRGSRGQDSAPPYLTELRKRVLALAHERDKDIATFVGRPPHLSRTYYTMDLPLDLPDSVIARSLADFEAAKAKLDRNGWSRDVMVNPASRLRAVVLLTMIREEVLELSLGPPVPHLAEQAQRILSKLESTWESIPHRQFEESMCDTMLPGEIWIIAGPRIEYLYTEFLLHKLLISQNAGNRDKMIQTSLEILNLALSLLKKNDTIATPNLEGMMVYYAMPCASVLILELFRQNHRPRQPTTLNRSTLIQAISLLISCCDSLAIAGQSNYQICKQAQTAFSQSLDQILNSDEVASNRFARAHEEDDVTELFSLRSMDFGLTDLHPQDPQWSMWLESFDLYEA